MAIRLHPHARARLPERGTTETEVAATIQDGERFACEFGRAGFRRDFGYNALWRGRYYDTKQVEVIAVREDDGWVVITVIVKFF